MLKHAVGRSSLDGSGSRDSTVREPHSVRSHAGRLLVYQQTRLSHSSKSRDVIYKRVLNRSASFAKGRIPALNQYVRGGQCANRHYDVQFLQPGQWRGSSREKRRAEDESARLFEGVSRGRSTGT